MTERLNHSLQQPEGFSCNDSSKEIMDANECIETARKAHVTLRSRTAGTRPDEQSAAAHQALKSALDQLWAAVEQRSDSGQIRNAITRLTADAEFFAGLNDSEGFRDETEVWQQYAYLKQAVASGPPIRMAT